MTGTIVHEVSDEEFNRRAAAMQLQCYGSAAPVAPPSAQAAVIDKLRQLTPEKLDEVEAHAIKQQTAQPAMLALPLILDCITIIRMDRSGQYPQFARNQEGQ